jgi:hypothetical protein
MFHYSKNVLSFKQIHYLNLRNDYVCRPRFKFICFEYKIRKICLLRLFNVTFTTSMFDLVRRTHFIHVVENKRTCEDFCLLRYNAVYSLKVNPYFGGTCHLRLQDRNTELCLLCASR